MITDHSYRMEGSNGIGVLLVHGLTGTPLEMRLLAMGLNRAGFTVAAPQLAGHCGTLDDLLATGWHDWYASVRAAAEALSRDVTHLVVGGLSMGALLSLLYAADFPRAVSAVGVYAATFKHDGWAVPPLARLSFALPLAKWLGIGRRRVTLENEPYGLRDEALRAQVAAALHGPDSSVAGLPGNPWHSLAELQVLSRHVRRRLPFVTAPCLVAHAEEDDVASLENARLVLRNVSGPSELLLLKDSYHMITIDRERRLLARHSAEFFAAAVA